MTRVRMWLLFAAAVAVYAVWWPEAPVIIGDSPQYLAVAQDLTDFRLDALHDRPPGYPALLALTGSTPVPGRTLFYVSLLFHVLSIAALIPVLRLCGASSRWILGLAGLLLLPLYVEPAAHVMTENLAQLALATGVSCVAVGWERKRLPLLIAAGVAIAVAALVRPTYQALAPVLGLVLLVAPREGARATPARLRDAGVLIATSLGLLTAVMAVNYRSLGSFTIVPTAGIHLTTRTSPIFERLPDEHAVARDLLIPARDALLVQPGGTHTGTQAIWSVKDDIAARLHLSKPQLSSYLVRMNLELIRRHPLDYLQEVARSASQYWFPAAGDVATRRSSVLRVLWISVHAAVVGLFFLQMIVLVGGWAWGQVRATHAQALAYRVTLTVILYTMALSCLVDIGEVRHRRPTDMLVVLTVIVGATIWRASRPSRVP